MTACGCPVEIPEVQGIGLVVKAIHYCPTHAAAFRLAETLAALTGSAEAYMRYHAEKFYSESDVKPTGLWPHINAARVLLREIGR